VKVKSGSRGGKSHPANHTVFPHWCLKSVRPFKCSLLKRNLLRFGELVDRFQKWYQIHKGRTAMHHHRHESGGNDLGPLRSGLHRVFDVDRDAPFTLCCDGKTHVDQLFCSHVWPHSIGGLLQEVQEGSRLAWELLSQFPTKALTSLSLSLIVVSPFL